MKQYVLTQMGQQYFARISENGVLSGIHVYERNDSPRLGEIYIGRVKDIRKDLHAAFVEIKPGLVGYLSLLDEKKLLFMNPKRNDEVHQGDLLLVQISKEAIKTKAPSVTCKLELSGEYVVVNNTFVGEIHLSKKITEAATRERLTMLANPYASETKGILLRTAAADVDEELLLKELQSLVEEFDRIYKYSYTRPAFYRLYQPAAKYITDLKEQHLTSEDIFITDLSCNDWHLEDLNLSCLVKHYQEVYPLYKNIGLPSDLEKLLHKVVWLPSGANLVIEVTEALTVIDVNTGKYESNKHRDEIFLKINKEAAAELVRQCILRKLSGMILVDFINMKDPAYTKELITYVKQLLYPYSGTFSFIDMTGLGLMEFTKKRVEKPLHEVISLKDIKL